MADQKPTGEMPQWPRHDSPGSSHTRPWPEFSAFAGELSRTHQEELLLKIKRRVGKQPVKVHIIAVAADEWARRLVLEQT